MKKTFKIILITLAALVAVGSIAAGVAAYRTVFGSIGKIDNENIVTVAPEMEDFETDGKKEDAVEVEPESVELETVPMTDDEKLINIMLVGQDRRPGEGRQRSDSMILCSYNPKTNELSIISFLRDLYVKIPGGYSDNRLNAPYAFGGFPLLYDTMKENFGITIDGGVEVDFDGFVELIDLLGGIDVQLSYEEAYEVNKECREYSYCEEGKNHLDGEAALAYARIRSIDSDFARAGRQRTVLLKLYEKAKKSSPETLMQLFKKALSMVTTDMTDGEMISIATKLLPKLASVRISTYTVPAEGDYQYASIREMSVLVPDLPAIKEKLENEYLPLD